MEGFISDWYLSIDLGNDTSVEEPDGEDNYNFD
jgi:hypothetical protein